MARDTLGDKLREKILADYLSGMRQRDLIKKYSIHKSTTSRIINHYKTRGHVRTIHGGGRPRKTTVREDRLILREAKKKPFPSAAKISNKLCLAVSDTTIRRRILGARITSGRPTKKSQASTAHSKTLRPRKNLQKSLINTKNSLSITSKKQCESSI
jgi:hypothetical protein